MSTKAIIYWVVGVLMVGGGIYGLISWSNTPGPLAPFAACLKDKGATFYGAWWCPHCQNQKKLFGKDQKTLPYVECSTADRRSQTQACIDKKIEGYPTWEFADGSRLSGEVSLDKLSEKTGCELPQAAN